MDGCGNLSADAETIEVREVLVKVKPPPFIRLRHMPETAQKSPAMPVSVADDWAAVYIDVSEKLAGDKGADERSPCGGGDENPVTTEEP